MLLLSTAAAAQTRGAEEGPTGTQVGFSFGAFVILPTIGARVTVPLGGPLAIEGAGELLPWFPFEDDNSKYLFFQGQLRHRFGRWGRWRAHATYGATVFARYQRVREFRQTRPDGSVLVHPGYHRFRTEDTLGLHGGIGAERLVSDQVVVRWDVQAIQPVVRSVIPIPRATVSFAWRPGGAR